MSAGRNRGFWHRGYRQCDGLPVHYDPADFHFTAFRKESLWFRAKYRLDRASWAIEDASESLVRAVRRREHGIERICVGVAVLCVIAITLRAIFGHALQTLAF